MLVFVLATIVFVAPWFRHGHNQTLYEDLRDMYNEAQGHYAHKKRPRLEEILAKGAARAREVAGRVLERVKSACGVRGRG